MPTTERLAPDEATKAKRAAAADIAVAEFRQILIWPLAIDTPSTGSMETLAAAIQAEATDLTTINDSSWRRIDDPLFHLTTEADEVRRAPGEPPLGPRNRQEAYAEFVYFHDFVQRFLYATDAVTQAGATPLYLFSRDDISYLQIEVWTGDTNETFKFRVDRCNLYLFPVGVAVLALEVTCTAGKPDQLTLAQVQYLQNCMRRCYTPYFEWTDLEGSKGYAPRGVPKSLQWLDKSGQPLSPVQSPATLRADLDYVVANREPPIFKHWIDVLPLNVKGQPKTNPASSAIWRHVVDERIPFTTFIRLAETMNDGHPLSAAQNLARVHEADLIRLCFADTPPSVDAEPGSYPYDRDFLKHFESENCYILAEQGRQRLGEVAGRDTLQIQDR